MVGLNVLLSLWLPSLTVIFATRSCLKLKQVVCALIRVDSARQPLNVEIEFSSSNMAGMMKFFAQAFCTCLCTFLWYVIKHLVPLTALFTMLGVWGTTNHVLFLVWFSLQSRQVNSQSQELDRAREPLAPVQARRLGGCFQTWCRCSVSVLCWQLW